MKMKWIKSPLANEHYVLCGTLLIAILVIMFTAVPRYLLADNGHAPIAPLKVRVYCANRPAGCLKAHLRGTLLIFSRPGKTPHLDVQDLRFCRAWGHPSSLAVRPVFIFPHSGSKRLIHCPGEKK